MLQPHAIGALQHLHVPRVPGSWYLPARQMGWAMDAIYNCCRYVHGGEIAQDRLALVSILRSKRAFCKRPDVVKSAGIKSAVIAIHREVQSGEAWQQALGRGTWSGGSCSCSSRVGLCPERGTMYKSTDNLTWKVDLGDAAKLLRGSDQAARAAFNSKVPQLRSNLGSHR